jgi:hypothetical protein
VLLGSSQLAGAWSARTKQATLAGGRQSMKWLALILGPRPSQNCSAVDEFDSRPFLTLYRLGLRVLGLGFREFIPVPLGKRACLVYLSPGGLEVFTVRDDEEVGLLVM